MTFFQYLHKRAWLLLAIAVLTVGLLISCGETPVETIGGTLPPPDTTTAPDTSGNAPDTSVPATDPVTDEAGETVVPPETTVPTQAPDDGPDTPDGVPTDLLSLITDTMQWLNLGDAKATASAEYGDNYRAGAAIDGDTGTRWTSASKNGIGSWLRIELPTAMTFDTIRLVDFVSNSNPARRLKTFTVSVSDDGNTFTKLVTVTLTEAQSKNMAAPYFDYPLPKTSAKFVQVTFDEMGAEKASMGIFELKLGLNEEKSLAIKSTEGKTLIETSANAMYGPVTQLIVRQADNENVATNLYSFTKADQRTVYLFLPCRADLSKVSFYALHANGAISGPYVADFTDTARTNKSVKIGTATYTVKAMQSNLPTLYLSLNEEHGTLAQVHASTTHEVYAYGDMVLDVTDELAAANGWRTQYTSRDTDQTSPESMRIRGRGNWTWKQLKRPYEFKIENSQNLLGMGSEKNWILLANYLDASLVRNQLFYDLARDMGMPYTPGIQPIDLFIDGVYQGSYSLATKIEIGDTRVDIDEDKDYLLEFDNHATKELCYFTTPQGFNISMKNLEDQANLKKITEIITNIENLMYDFSSNEYAKYIDMDSWVKCYWIHDIARNNDTLRGSSYMYYVVDEGKLYAGPLWDFDNTSMIHTSGKLDEPEGWHSMYEVWFKALIQHSDFRAAVDEYYKNGGLRELIDTIGDRIDGYEDYLKDSADMNYTVIARRHWLPAAANDTWEGDVAYLKQYQARRAVFYKNYYNGIK